MVRIVHFVILLFLFGLSQASLEDFLGHNSIGKQHEQLDSNGMYMVEWEAYLDTQTVIFELTVATTGFVGFGISPVGGMTGADIIIGGVHPNGSIYFSNRHGIGNQMPVVDDNETWELLAATENGTHTYLKVGRLWNTCDLQDVSIENSTNNFIWSYGSNDDIAYHGDNRGTSANLILEPPLPSLDVSKFQLWEMTHVMEMPAKKTTYWCTMHKSPPLPTKHHIVGYRPVLETPEALRHIHHFNVHKCRVPDGSTGEETFESFVGQPGGECYTGSSNAPVEHCESFLLLWAVGGKTVIYPEHVGFPFAVDGKPNYYMLETHYDNPHSLSGLTFKAGVELFYTSELRDNDAGTLTMGHFTSWSITIPPKSVDYMAVGHCSPSCSRYIPESGINVFNIMLHSHLAGRKLRVRHFRDGEELPWLSTDDNYDFDYQQNRILLEEVKLLPGDHVTYECTYNSMNANGSVIGGFSTSEEMCNTFAYYYPEIDLDMCNSEVQMDDLMKRFGIEQMEGSVDPRVTAPESMANLLYTDVLDTMTNWTTEFRDQLQEATRYGEHRTICMLKGQFISITDTIKYPNITKKYTPIDECADRQLPSSAKKQILTQYSLHFMTCILAMIYLMS